jgi:hypothetical protein
MTKDITQQIEESRGLIEQTALSLEWLNVDMAHSKRLIAESRLLLEIADAAAVTATVLSAINTAGPGPQGRASRGALFLRTVRDNRITPIRPSVACPPSNRAADSDAAPRPA